MNQSEALSCPFCPFSDTDASFLEMHIDHCHPENGDWHRESHQPEVDAWSNARSHSQSPREADEDPTEKYVDCPHGCGETVTTAELSTHLDLHLAEGIAFEDGETDSAPYIADDSANTDDYDLPLGKEDELDLQGALEGGKRGSGRDMARRNNVTKPAKAKSPPRHRGEDGAMRLGVSRRLTLCV